MRLNSNKTLKNITKILGNPKGDFPDYYFKCLKCKDHRERLGIHLLKKIGQCFNCGFKINPKFFDELVNKEFIQENFLEYLKDECGRVIQTTEKSLKVDTPILKYEGFKLHEAPKNYLKYVNKAKTYLQSRGFSWRVLSKRFGFGVGFKDTRYENRLIMPVYEHGRLVYFQARSLENKKPKYLNPKDTHKEKFLFAPKNFFGFGFGKTLYISEGIFSALSISPKKSIAIFGKSLSEYQFLKIRNLKSVEKIFVCLDPGAEKEAYEICNKLASCFQTYFVDLKYGDPNDLRLSGKLKERLKHARRFV